MTNGMNVTNKTVLFTGANRGIGRALAAAAGIFDELANGEEEIFPDPASASIAGGWRNGAVKALDRRFAAFVLQRRQMTRSGYTHVPDCASRAGTGKLDGEIRRRRAICARYASQTQQ
jgi:hypothetical protein